MIRRLLGRGEAPSSPPQSRLAYRIDIYYPSWMHDPARMRAFKLWCHNVALWIKSEAER